jgi:hypothetical protein
MELKDYSLKELRKLAQDLDISDVQRKKRKELCERIEEKNVVSNVKKGIQKRNYRQNQYVEWLPIDNKNPDKCTLQYDIKKTIGTGCYRYFKNEMI